MITETTLRTLTCCLWALCPQITDIDLLFTGSLSPDYGQWPAVYGLSAPDYGQWPAVYVLSALLPPDYGQWRAVDWL